MTQRYMNCADEIPEAVRYGRTHLDTLFLMVSHLDRYERIEYNVYYVIARSV